jgi:hypothetical protein
VLAIGGGAEGSRALFLAIDSRSLGRIGVRDRGGIRLGRRHKSFPGDASIESSVSAQSRAPGVPRQPAVTCPGDAIARRYRRSRPQRQRGPGSIT